jgi:hypothetical protein
MLAFAQATLGRLPKITQIPNDDVRRPLQMPCAIVHAGLEKDRIITIGRCRP